MLKFFEEKLEIKSRSETVQSFKNQEKEISVIKMKSLEEKEDMKNKKKLRGTQIYIDHDLTKMESTIQKKIKERAKM